VDPSRYAFVQGWTATRTTLRRWNAEPWPVLRVWIAGGLVVALALLAAVWVIAEISTPDPTGYALPGLNRPVTPSAVGGILFRNGLVLALHAFACVAGFIAGSSLPLQAERHTGLQRWLHEKAGPAAIAFVVAATTFSLCTQAYVLGNVAATLAAQVRISPFVLLLTLAPHALLELVALFLPLAAWLIASRRGEWRELLAATFSTVALAVPMLLLAAALEVTLWPDLLRLVSARY
jgi:Stage II sporulation protein M